MRVCRVLYFKAADLTLLSTIEPPEDDSMVTIKNAVVSLVLDGLLFWMQFLLNRI